MTREDKVRAFREAADKGTFSNDPTQVELVSTCIAEEIVELFQAINDYYRRPTPENRAQLCKEWADSQYVLSQAAVYFEIPAEPSFNRVHDSNMTKVVDGKVKFREDGKILKPDTYVAPDMGGL